MSQVTVTNKYWCYSIVLLIVYELRDLILKTLSCHKLLNERSISVLIVGATDRYDGLHWVTYKLHNT